MGYQNAIQERRAMGVVRDEQGGVLQHYDAPNASWDPPRNVQRHEDRLNQMMDMIDHQYGLSPDEVLHARTMLGSDDIPTPPGMEGMEPPHNLTPEATLRYYEAIVQRMRGARR